MATTPIKASPLSASPVQQSSSNTQYKALVAGSETQTTHSNNGAISFSSFHQHLGPAQPTLVTPIKAFPVQQQQQSAVYAAVATQPIQSSYFPPGYAKSFHYNASPVAPYQQQSTIAGPTSAAIYTNEPNYQTIHFGTHLYQPAHGHSRISYGGLPKYS